MQHRRGRHGEAALRVRSKMRATKGAAARAGACCRREEEEGGGGKDQGTEGGDGRGTAEGGTGEATETEGLRDGEKESAERARAKGSREARDMGGTEEERREGAGKVGGGGSRCEGWDEGSVRHVRDGSRVPPRHVAVEHVCGVEHVPTSRQGVRWAQRGLGTTLPRAARTETAGSTPHRGHCSRVPP
eukprot:3116231-Rhodomonas_salina.2